MCPYDRGVRQGDPAPPVIFTDDLLNDEFHSSGVTVDVDGRFVKVLVVR